MIGPHHATALQSASGYQQEADALLAGLHRDFVAAVEQAASGCRGVGRRSAAGSDTIGLHRGGPTRCGKARAGEHVRKGMARSTGSVLRLPGGTDIAEIGSAAMPSTGRPAPEIAAHHAHPRPVVVHDVGDVLVGDVLVAASSS